MADETRKRLVRQIKGPKGYQREFQGPTISGSLEILPSRMLFRIPAFPAHSVSLSSRTDTAFWIRESLLILHPEILSRFTLTHDLCGDTPIYIHIRGASSARIRAIGRGKCRLLSAKLIHRRASLKIYIDLSSISRKRAKVRAIFETRWSKINRLCVPFT